MVAQTARFLQSLDLPPHGPIDVDEIDDSGSNMVQCIYDKAQSTVSVLIVLFVERGRGYVRAALGSSQKGHFPKDKTYRNTDFDATTLSMALTEKVGALLLSLPFEVRVCTSEMPLGGSGSIVSNVMWDVRTSVAHSRHGYLLCRLRNRGNLSEWRESLGLGRVDQYRRQGSILPVVQIFRWRQTDTKLTQ